ncbi:condensation domain-containing protein [Streptomyces sp. NBC_00443]|uniref:condensation domain-containing protein n=1 Tax=Streptomyces sp. NBC_00443 TaxID=2975743 RepID=UPI003FA7D30C
MTRRDVSGAVNGSSVPADPFSPQRAIKDPRQCPATYRREIGGVGILRSERHAVTGPAPPLWSAPVHRSGSVSRLALSEVRHDVRLPVTAAQLGVWVAQRLEPESPLYQCAVHFDSVALDIEVLRRAVIRAVAETDTLRSRFGDDGEVFQIVRAQVDATVDLVGLRAEADPEAAAHAWMDRDLATVADLEAGPLFRHALPCTTTGCSPSTTWSWASRWPPVARRPRWPPRRCSPTTCHCASPYPRHHVRRTGRHGP